MSNCEVFHLKPVFELEQHQVREVLRILLHTVIFNRALGPVKPVERDSELFEITWVSLEGRTDAASSAGGARERKGGGGRAHAAAPAGVLPSGGHLRRALASAAMPADAEAALDGGQHAPQPRKQPILAPCKQPASSRQNRPAWWPARPPSSAKAAQLAG